VSGAYVIAAAAVFAVGLYGVLMSRHLLRKIIALNVMGSAAFILIVAAAGGTGSAPGGTGSAPDPVAQALVLTGIVIAVASTAFALALLVRIFRETGRTDLDE
jgi:multicomponent Na+:H+ antiporter subunit C